MIRTHDIGSKLIFSFDLNNSALGIIQATKIPLHQRGSLHLDHTTHTFELVVSIVLCLESAECESSLLHMVPSLRTARVHPRADCMQH